MCFYAWWLVQFSSLSLTFPMLCPKYPEIPSGYSFIATEMLPISLMCVMVDSIGSVHKAQWRLAQETCLVWAWAIQPWLSLRRLRMHARLCGYCIGVIVKNDLVWACVEQIIVSKSMDILFNTVWNGTDQLNVFKSFLWVEIAIGQLMSLSLGSLPLFEHYADLSSDTCTCTVPNLSILWLITVHRWSALSLATVISFM